MGNAAQCHKGMRMCLLFPILGFVKFIDVSTAAKVRLHISVKNKKRFDTEELPNSQTDAHKTPGNHCIMPFCEIKPLLFGRLDDSSYNLANFLFYTIYKIERKPRSWIRRLQIEEHKDDAPGRPAKSNLCLDKAFGMSERKQLKDRR